MLRAVRREIDEDRARAEGPRLCCHARVPAQTISSLEDPRIAGFRDLKDARATARAGLFVVEGRDNLRRLLEQPQFRARSVLVTPTALAALSQELQAPELSFSLFVAEPELLKQIAGFNIHRGCLALAERGAPRAPKELADGDGGLLLALEYVGNPDNIGGIFRNAMAFGASGVLLCPRCCDPLYRKAIRTSMGGTLKVPFASSADFPGELRALHAAGHEIVALHPTGDAEPLGCEAVGLPASSGIVLLLGNEGEGLSAEALDAADRRIQIPMAVGVDSLNVATASGIALHHFAQRGGAHA